MLFRDVTRYLFQVVDRMASDNIVDDALSTMIEITVPGPR